MKSQNPKIFSSLFISSVQTYAKAAVKLQSFSQMSKVNHVENSTPLQPYLDKSSNERHRWYRVEHVPAYTLMFLIKCCNTNLYLLHVENTKIIDFYCSQLCEICEFQHSFKLLLRASWWKTMVHVLANQSLFLILYLKLWT